ncbi:hypothetical protein ACS0TY_026524 [Phlomoides rotata]
MEEAIVGAAVGATIKVLLQNLISVSMKEIKLIRGYKKDLEKLRSSLMTIQEFVNGAETLQVTDISVKRWLKKLEGVAFEAYYVLDEIDYLSLRKDRYKMEMKTTFKKKIKSIASGSKFYDRLKLGHKIGDINKEFDLINRESSSLGLPTRLADTIGELYHLLTLRAESYNFRKLPSTLKYLISLRHLHVSYNTKYPGELGRLTSLQTIPYFRVGDEKGHRIEELGSLKNLKGILRIWDLQKVRDKKEAKSACIFQKPNIVELELLWNGPKEGETNYENVLEGLQPHPNLKKLKINGFEGTRFPSWASKMAVQDDDHWKRLNNLMEITLAGCSECEEIPMMGHLPCLKSLYLSGLRNVKSISSTFYGIDHCNGVCNDTVIIFPALERLVLSSMPNMTEWVEVEVPENQSRGVKVFPCLEYLHIRNCNKLRGAPSHFPCLKKLEIEGMDSGLALANICGTKLTSLTRLDIREIQELECLPHGLFYNNQHLQELDIRGCPRLRELADGLRTLNSLQELTIERCPSLKSIPDCSSGSFTSLRHLVIRDCPELMNISCEMVESCAPSLERLHLRGLRGDSWDCVSFKEAVDGILLRFGSNSLRELELSGKEDWELLPDQLQHLSSIISLRLSDFGIQQLPEWFGNLSSLEELSLRNCKRLRSLPSVEAMPRLTNLTYLHIHNCPLLKESLPSVQRLTNLRRLYVDNCPLLQERCTEQKRSDDDDSQWTNNFFFTADGNTL